MSGTPPACDGDGHPTGSVCTRPIAVECECRQCQQKDPNDRYHACLEDRNTAATAHGHEYHHKPTWKAYVMPHATEASPPPAAEDKGSPMCDGSAMGEKPCQTPPNWECTCKRCARESDSSERFHACEAHKGAAADRHRQVRERPAEWSAYWPPVLPWVVPSSSIASVRVEGLRVEDGDEIRVVVDKAKVSPRDSTGGFSLASGPFPGPEFEKAMRELQLLVYGEGALGPSAGEIMTECHELTRLLLIKNHKYGDSALNPRRVFAKADAVEQIKVRIDDKINRIEKGDASIEDEDMIQDLLGYLILLRIATKRKAIASAKKDP